MSDKQEQPIKLNKKGNRRGMTEGSARNYGNIEGHKWQKGQSGNPEGKNRSRIPALLATYLGKKKAEQVEGLNSREINEIEMMVLSLGNKELNALIKGDDVPMYLKGLALAALHDAKNGRTKTIDLLRDRQFGAVKKEVDVTSNGQSVTPQSMTPREAQEMLKKIEESC